MRALTIELTSLVAALLDGGNSPLLQPTDISDWSECCRMLNEQFHKDLLPGNKVIKSLSKRVQKEIFNRQVTEHLKVKLVAALNEILPELDEETVSLLSSEVKIPLSLQERLRLNRQLLEVLLPGVLRPSYQLMIDENQNKAFSWISEHTAPNIKEVLNTAVAQYRRRLLEATDPTLIGNAVRAIIVDPANHAQLLMKCEEAANRPSDERIYPRKEGWPGLSIIFSDGTTDCISIQSLFGDVTRLYPAYFNLENTDGSDKPWRLNKGKPMIGNYLASIAGWGKVYSNACETVKSFPSNGEAHNGNSINQLLGQTEQFYKLTRFLTLMFQCVRLFYAASQSWSDSYSNFAWLPQKSEFTDIEIADVSAKNSSLNDNPSLKNHLEKLYDSIAHAIECDEVSGLENYEVKALFYKPMGIISKPDAEQRDNNPTWYILHMQLLQNLGLVKLVQNGAIQEWQLREETTKFPAIIPQCPPELLVKWVSFNKENGAISSLASSLGLRTPGGSADYVQLYRIIEGAIGGDKQFLKSIYTTGECPKWLRRLCQTYATEELGWTDSTHWPSFLK